ncbi:pilus assembly protein PilP [Vibrio mediterranei]|nr:pilus assembly protein PilP [Vibrio mediterranei]EDL53863.1 fimbrial assembly protein PilP, putative [Vibrio mediterranei AK1]MCY9853687.1 pilus assembly protein PilP [Vibrio mediterranei]NUW73789.1 pilus assembly protein PilP [Vibrio mediterranei]
MLVRISLMLISIAVLMGCRAKQDPLNEFVTQVLREAKTTQADTPFFPTIEVIKFTPINRSSPFDLPAMIQNHSQSVANLSCWQPKIRSKVPLERYSLNDMQLKGVMGKGEQRRGLVALPINRIVTVSAGQYIGENSGLIKQITADKLIIHETLPDGLGCWRQRQITLALK